jgi:hypothetical protein
MIAPEIPVHQLASTPAQLDCALQIRPQYCGGIDLGARDAIQCLLMWMAKPIAIACLNHDKLWRSRPQKFFAQRSFTAVMGRNQNL